jgi:flavodoxin
VAFQIGTIRDIIEPRGATIVGHWPTAGYHFEASKGLADDVSSSVGKKSSQSHCASP